MTPISVVTALLVLASTTGGTWAIKKRSRAPAGEDAARPARHNILTEYNPALSTRGGDSSGTGGRAPGENREHWDRVQSLVNAAKNRQPPTVAANQDTRAKRVTPAKTSRKRDASRGVGNQVTTDKRSPSSVLGDESSDLKTAANDQREYIYESLQHSDAELGTAALWAILGQQQANIGLNHPAASVGEDQRSKDYDDDDSTYRFGFRVSDANTGADYGRAETRQGRVTKGNYHVLLPDGRLQNVDYWADHSGYHVQVTYTGVAHH